VPEYLEYWARLKGINVIGTGDCIHPGWQQELAEKLEPCGNGLFRLRNEYRLEESKRLRHEFIPDEIFFMLTGELSSIYKRDGKVRKVHNICVFPDMDSLKKVQSRLDEAGNIRSDGRPILGIDSRIILDMVLQSSSESFIIPAHIWTPWFSVLGSKSGFDTIEECYGDLTPEIFAVETGLSSDPEMNWRCSFLDSFRLVSNSDAHSPEKLGREANLFDTELSYFGIYHALKHDKGFRGTIEFYPEEGKYHYDGHRNCGIVWNPLETLTHGGICPVCGKEVTKGVMYRIAELGDRSDVPDSIKKDFYSITQLPDLLSEVMRQKSSSSKSVMSEYFRVIHALGSEFHLYLDSDIDEINSSGGELLAEGVRRLRNGEVHLKGGYDGEFGAVKVFDEGELDTFKSKSLFKDKTGVELHPVQKKKSVEFDVAEFRRISAMNKVSEAEAAQPVPEKENGGVTSEQAAAVNFSGGPGMVIAGPGAGKTFLIVERIKRITDEGVQPSKIAVLTFSNKAADELRERLGEALRGDGLHVSTFHSLGLNFITGHPELFGLSEGFIILNDEERLHLLKNLFPEKTSGAGTLLRKISAYKQGIETDIEPAIIYIYNSCLIGNNFIDVDDLIYLPPVMAEACGELRSVLSARFTHVVIDEFQDINFMQYRFIRLLAPGSGADIFVIGDPDQSIYGFRGAAPEYIHRLKSDYPELREFMLKKSFRCSAVILRAAGQILGRGEYLSSDKKGVKLIISEMASDRSEADWIASEIERMVGGVRSFSMDSGMADGENRGRGFGDFAVLCRSSFMFECFREAFMNHGIAYKVAGSRPFYEFEPYKSVIQQIRSILTGINSGEETSDALKKLMDDLPVAELIIKLLEQNGTEFDRMRVQSAFGRMRSYDDFLRTLPLRTGEDDYLPDYEAVSLMTIHSAKGLEFDTVFIPGCEDDIIPFNLFGADMSDLSEEERIFYVALTRAKKQVYLTSALKRWYKGKILEAGRSRFIDRIEKGIIEAKKRTPFKKKEDDGQLNLF
jgi:uncharacterized protein (TIGR00375 family)